MEGGVSLQPLLETLLGRGAGPAEHLVRLGVHHDDRIGSRRFSSLQLKRKLANEIRRRRGVTRYMGLRDRPQKRLSKIKEKDYHD